MLLALALSLTACGKSGEEQPARPAQGESQRPSGPEPLKGRDVSRASELVGVWMRTTPGDFVGLEFLKNDQVIVTTGQGPRPSAMTLSFSLLDGGRLSLVSGGGATTIYQTTRSKDTLELTPESAGTSPRSQRFIKLAAGQTLADGLRAQAEALDQERLARVQSLVELLGRDGLVIRPGSAAGGAGDWAGHLVVEPGFAEHGGEFEGVFTLDPATARDDVLRPVTVHAVQGRLSPVDDITGHVRLSIVLAPAQEPAGQEDVRGRVEIVSEGLVDKPTLSGTFAAEGRFAGAVPATLARDSAAASAISQRLAAQRAAREAAIRVVTDALGGRVRLRGERLPLGGGAAEPILATIELAPDGRTYTVVADVGPRTDQQGQAAVGLVIGRGALYVALPTGEQWRLHIEDDGSLKGPWRPNPRADFISSGNVALTIERSWTVAEVEAERAAIARFMSQGLRTPRRFTGTMMKGRGGDREYHPLTLTLSATPDGAAIGELWSLGSRTGVAVSGRVSGNRVNLAPTGFLPGSEQSRIALQQRLAIELAAAEPVPTFRGLSGADELRLELSEDAGGDGTELIEEIRGKRFVVRNTSISQRPEPTYLLLDDSLRDGALTGMLVGHDITGSTSAKLPPALVRIEIGEERGHQVLRIAIDSCPQVMRGYESERFTFTGIVRRDDDGLIIQAWDAPAAGNIAWWRMEPVSEEERIAVSEEQRIRLAAQRMGAVVNPPQRPSPGDSVLLLTSATERDLRVGQFFFADGRYAGSAIAAAAVHAGVVGVGELALVRLTYREPFTENTPRVEANGATSSAGRFTANTTTPTFTIEAVRVEMGS